MIYVSAEATLAVLFLQVALLLDDSGDLVAHEFGELRPRPLRNARQEFELSQSHIEEHLAQCKLAFVSWWQG